MSVEPPEEQESEIEENWHEPAKPKQQPLPKSKRKKPRWFIAAIAAILLAIASIAIIAIRSRQPKTDPIAELTVPVAKENLTVRIQASGTVRPIQSVNLSPKTSGRVAELLVEQGDRVEEGETIAIMESNDLNAQLIQARGGLEQAQARLAQLRSGNRPEEIAQARARLQQAEARLAQLRSGNRPEEIAQARARLDQAEARLAQLRSGNRPEEIAQARARLDQAEARLAQLRSGNRPEEIAQARAQVEAAEATQALTQERVRRNELLAAEGAISQDSLEEVLTEWRRAKANLREAERRLDLLENGTRFEEIAQAEAQVVEAREALRLQQRGTRFEEIAQAEAQVVEAREALRLQQRGTRFEEIAQAEAQVVEAREALRLQQRGTRFEEIAQAEAQVAEAQYALTLQEKGTRPEEIAQAEAQAKEALGRLQAVGVQLEDSFIRAPFAGQITQRFATEGAFVTPTTSASTAGSATSTSVVALARGLEVLAKVPEADIGQIKPNQQVEIVAEAYPDEVFTGRVRLIAPEAVKEQDVTLFEIRVEIDSGADKLQSGMNVDIIFLGDALEDALVVPTVAIVSNKGKTGILVPNDKNKAEFRPVTVGPTIGDRTQILSGASAGDRVFIGLPEGQRLEDILDTK